MINSGEWALLCLFLLHATRWRAVPDADAPDADGRATLGTVARRQKLKLAPGYADDRLALLRQDA